MIIKLGKLGMRLINCRILREFHYFDTGFLFSIMFGIELVIFARNSVLDFSFNLLRTVPDRLEYLRSLHTIYFIQNKISKITGLTSCSSLRSLELGGNKIRVSSEQLSFKACNELNISL